MKWYVLLLSFILYPFTSFGQLFLPANITKKSIQDEGMRIDLLGNGTYYRQESGSKSAASGGAVVSIPTKNKNLLYASVKYNPAQLKRLVLRDTAFNIKNYLPAVAEQIFGFENGSIYNLGLRFNKVKERNISKTSKYGIWSFLFEFNATPYAARVDSAYWNSLDSTFRANNSLSSGFYLLNPVLGATKEWLFSTNKKNDQNVKISMGLWLAATFIYENDAGMNIIPSYNYMILGQRALDKNFALNQKLKSFYAGLFSLAFELNDFRLFFTVQHNQVLFRTSELEIKGINNRAVFINLGAGFSPSIIHFNF
ncbi:MAG: hypothetical protein NZ455_05025 [Bacteroidia bacterium]|nr:hypothetical protein [Bacteroidia bacterium]MDW8346450.1 hypothetical protein [Bacteroidia bacterium]